jgi:hypothetical protein
MTTSQSQLFAERAVKPPPDQLILQQPSSFENSARETSSSVFTSSGFIDKGDQKPISYLEYVFKPSYIPFDMLNPS